MATVNAMVNTVQLGNEWRPRLACNGLGVEQRTKMMREGVLISVDGRSGSSARKRISARFFGIELAALGTICRFDGTPAVALLVG